MALNEIILKKLFDFNNQVFPIVTSKYQSIQMFFMINLEIRNCDLIVILLPQFK